MRLAAASCVVPILAGLAHATEPIPVERLQSLPSVVEVTVRPSSRPTHQVIHILDWHYVPEKRFRLDTPDGEFEAFLGDVEALQAQQRTFVKALGVKSVFLEGLTSETEQHFLKRVDTLRKYKPAIGDEPLAVFVRQLRREDLLELGAPAAMLIAGEIEAVHPADDPALHRAADPVKGDRLEFDESANKAREDGMAKLLVAQRHSLVILGGEHDLTDNLPAHVEYVRVKLRKYPGAAAK